MASESRLREQKWIKEGCNAFECKRPVSQPMSFWTEQDVLEYIRKNDIKIASVYGDIYYDIPDQLPGQTLFEWAEECISGCKLCTTGCDRTGCIFCGFGAHLEKGEGRFERLKRTHPKQYDFCMNGGSYDSDGIWKPDKNGLGMKHVIDTLNSLYGEDFIKY
jgi:3'-phosphoadenosine 5'-phosphosulfate sulfotransferase (PAPS reductase)/FAD synthetase